VLRQRSRIAGGGVRKNAFLLLPTALFFRRGSCQPAWAVALLDVKPVCCCLEGGESRLFCVVLFFLFFVVKALEAVKKKKSLRKKGSRKKPFFRQFPFFFRLFLSYRS